MRSFYQHLRDMVWVLITAVFACTLPSPHAHAQTSAQITGVVTEQSGAVVPHANIQLKNEASGVESKTVSDSEGTYFFDPVLPGTYTVTVEVNGFETETHTGIAVYPAARISINVQLHVGSTSQTVQVTGDNASIPTDSGAVTQVITAAQIENLSTVGRNAIELLTLLPGVVAGGASGTNNSYNALQGSSSINNSVDNFNVNGLRNDMNMLNSDGSSVLGPGNNGTMLLEPNMDMISEITVKTSNFEADQGSSGMIVETVTKSGGNHYRGELYWYARNAFFDANDWSNNHANEKRPNSIYNYPGFNIGGPVLIPGTSFNHNRNKTFFFVGAEWQRQRTDYGSIFSVVPTQQMRSGNFSELLTGSTCASTGYYLQMPCQLTDPATGLPLANNMIPPAELTKNGAIQLGLLPTNNYQDPLGLYNYAVPTIEPRNRTEQILRLDQDFTDKTRAYVRLARNAEENNYLFGEVYDTPGGYPSNVKWPTAITGPVNTKSIVMDLTHSFSTRLVNDAHFGSTALDNSNRYQDPTVLSKKATGYQFGGVAAFNVNNDGIPMMIDFSGLPGTQRWAQYGGDLINGFGAQFTLFDWNDDLTWELGKHLLKFGFVAGRTRSDGRSGNKVEGLLATGEWGTTTGSEFGDVLVDRYHYYAQSSADLESRFRDLTLEGYAQDSWKVTRRLTLNYGLRISYLAPWSEIQGLAVTFNPSAYVPNEPSNTLNGILQASKGQIPDSVVPDPTPVFAPRVGFAWDLFGRGKSVLRGGFGIYTLRDQQNTISNWSVNNPPNVYTVQFQDYCCGGFTEEDIEAADPYGVLGNLTINPRDTHDKKVPQTNEYSLSWDQDIGLKTVVEASYVGNETHHLFGYWNLNAVPPGAMWSPGTQLPASAVPESYRPYTPWGDIYWAEHNMNSNFNSFQGSLRRMVSTGLMVMASYTWSKSLGDDASTGNQAYAFNQHLGYGLEPYDRNQSLSVAYVYGLPSLAKLYLNGNKIGAGILDGWRMSGQTRYVDGPPLDVSVTPNACVTSPGETNPTTLTLCPYYFIGGADAGITWYGTPDDPVLPVILSRPAVGKSFHKIGDPWVGNNFFTLPAFGQLGNFSQPTYRAPAFNNWDWALAKSFPLGANEAQHVNFRWSMFNMFNRPQLNSPNMSAIENWVLAPGATTLAQGSGEFINTATYGKILGKTGHRAMEFALKIEF